MISIAFDWDLGHYHRRTNPTRKIYNPIRNKAKLIDLIIVIGLTILLKLDSFFIFRPFDLEIWWMNSKSNRAPPLCHVKLCLFFQKAIGEYELELQSGNAQFR